MAQFGSLLSLYKLYLPTNYCCSLTYTVPVISYYSFLDQLTACYEKPFLDNCGVEAGWWGCEYERIGVSLFLPECSPKCVGKFYRLSKNSLTSCRLNNHIK